MRSSTAVYDTGGMSKIFGSFVGRGMLHCVGNMRGGVSPKRYNAAAEPPILLSHQSKVK